MIQCYCSTGLSWTNRADATRISVRNSQNEELLVLTTYRLYECDCNTRHPVQFECMLLKLMLLNSELQTIMLRNVFPKQQKKNTCIGNKPNFRYQSDNKNTNNTVYLRRAQSLNNRWTAQPHCHQTAARQTRTCYYSPPTWWWEVVLAGDHELAHSQYYFLLFPF